MCPSLLWHSQLSSSKFMWHSSSSFVFNMYTFSGDLDAVSTNFPESFLLISHFLESKMQMCPWSQVWLTLNKLGFNFSTSNTFLALSFPKFRVPFPRMLPEALSPNVIFLYVVLSSIICFVSCHVFWTATVNIPEIPFILGFQGNKTFLLWYFFFPKLLMLSHVFRSFWDLH